ncbi:MAG: protein kinase, partial [Polyangiaceae bacterium]|nr:protein kinase [Polyangiaceae bacterium]
MRCPSETHLQAFVEGDLTSSELAEVSQHLDVCSACRTLVGLVQPVPLHDDHVADRVGRYVLRRALGKGGMGVVFEAADPDLHRVVALKVLRPELGDLQRRLLAEAEAMAALSHPNVVTIYDVGRAQDRVFIVMELIHGVSLRHWLARQQPSLQAVLDVFAQAGEGLAAAHAAGLVHRDFKPENVFVAVDGRVRVGDFGLAVPCGMQVAAGEGSAGYMAPEQQKGQQLDARSDQYSFCVALQEAVRLGMAQQKLYRRRVPRWLSRAIARGTAQNPAERFPSMDALVTVLRSGRQRSRSAKVGVATAIAAGVVAGSVALWSDHDDFEVPALCRDGDQQLQTIWNPAVARRVEQAFREPNNPIGQGTWRRTDRVLTQYTNEWAQAHRRVCEDASRTRGEDAAALLGRKADCLADRLGLLRAVVEALQHADVPMLEQAPAVLQLLARVDSCEDVHQIAQLAPPAP